MKDGKKTEHKGKRPESKPKKDAKDQYGMMWSKAKGKKMGY